jgi:hypothetical protein
MGLYGRKLRVTQEKANIIDRIRKHIPCNGLTRVLIRNIKLMKKKKYQQLFVFQ